MGCSQFQQRQALIEIDNLGWIAIGDDLCLCRQDDAIAVLCDLLHVVRHKEDGLSVLRKFSMRAKHFSWNAASATARISSTRRISGLTSVATAKASLVCIPEEYCLMGASMNSPISAKSMMLCSRTFISSLE